MSGNMQTKEGMKKQPDIFLLIAQKSLTVAQSIRHRFVDNTFELADKLEELIKKNEFVGFKIKVITDFLKNQYITAGFVDGGLSNVEIFNSIPLIIRGGIFEVKEGEQDLEKREIFEFFPVLIGDVEGGEKSNNDYASVIRIISELGSVMRILTNEKFLDIRLIMLHGPLLYRLSAYSDHWFYKDDYKTILSDKNFGDGLIKEFESEFRSYYFKDPNTTVIKDYKRESKINANCFIAFLLKKAFYLSKKKNIALVGVVERPTATEIIQNILPKTLEKFPDLTDKFLITRTKDYKLDAESIINNSRFNDPLIFAMILKVGEYLSFYKAKERYTGFSGKLAGFEKNLPGIRYSYLRSSYRTLPIRVEIPQDATQENEDIAIKKVYEYSKILPNYAFPIGLHVADKFAKVPNWLTDAYKKYILFNFGKLVSDEELNTDEMFRLLQFYFLNQRDFFYRPK